MIRKDNFMSKKTLNIREKCMIQSLINEHSTSVEEVATLLNKDIEIIEKYVNGELQNIKQAVDNIKGNTTKTKDKKKAKPINLVEKGIVNVTAGKKNKGVAILTEMGSQKLDEARKIVRRAQSRGIDKNSIFRPHND